MDALEIVPGIQQNKQFPIGDLVDTYKDKKVNEWFAAAMDMSTDRFWSEVKYNSAPQFSNDKADRTHAAAVALCESWDQANENQIPYVHFGYRLSMLFNNKTQYLPPCGMDLSEDLDDMQLPEENGGKLNSSRAFGKTAWQSMELYPNVHETYQRLAGFAIDRYGLYTDESLLDFKTGMALPFMFAWATRLHGYANILPLWLTNPCS